MNKSDLFLLVFKNRKIMVPAFFPHGAAFCDFGATWFYSDYGLMVLVKKKDQPGEKLVFKVFHNNTRRMTYFTI